MIGSGTDVVRDFATVVDEELRREIAAQIPGNEERRHLSQDIAERLAAHGFYNLCTPPEAGGQNQSPMAYAEVVEALAQADASTAWCVFIGITSSWAMAGADAMAIDERLSAPGVVTAGVFAPVGRARRTRRDGVDGYAVSGRWSWGSGTRNADWIAVGCLLEGDDGQLSLGEDGRPVPVHAMVGRPDVTHHDTWHVSGLKGTGSSEFSVDDAFVSNDRMIFNLANPSRQHALYEFPAFGMLGIGVAATALGAARAGLDDVVGLARAKTPQGHRRSLAQRSATQADIAKAEALLKSARAYFYSSIDQAWNAARQGALPLERRADLRLATTHAVQSAKAAIDLLYDVAGGSSIFLSSPIQRRYADIHVMTQHMMVSTTTFEMLGRVLLGLETDETQI